VVRPVDWEGIMQKYGVKNVESWPRFFERGTEPLCRHLKYEILQPRSLKKSNVEELSGPRFSTDTGWKTYCALRSAYLAVFLSAAWSATSPAPVAAVSTYDSANVLATVTSHRRGLPLCHGIRDNPPGRFPSCLFRPDGSLTAGTSAAYYYYKDKFILP